MALFNKKKTADTPASSAAPSSSAPPAGADTSTAVDDFSDFSADAVQAASTPAAGGKKGKAPKVARAEKKPSGPRGALRNGAFVGLNIGSDSVKVVEAQAKNGILSITGMGMVPTPSDSISNGVVMSVNALAGAIKDALNQAGIKSRKVVTSVSGTGALVVRIIEVPKMSDGELEDNMKMDADRYIPFPPSEVIMDFKALRELPSDPDAMNMEVLLAAAQREIIDLHIQVLQDARLDPRAIDVEPLAAARALTHPLTTGNDINAQADYSDVAAILNIGASGTEISILRGDILVFTRTVPSGGNALTQAISDTLGLAWHDAEGLKREMGDALAPNEITAPGAGASQNGNGGFDTAGFDAPATTDYSAGVAEGDGDWSEFDLGEAPDPATSTPAVAASLDAPGVTDPFDDGFFEQGPQNAEPGEQHQQKETDEVEDDAASLPTREGDLTSTEAITGALDADAIESTVLPTKDANAASEVATSPATAPATPEAQASTPVPTTDAENASGMPDELRALFNFEEVEEPDEVLPTVEEGKPSNYNSLLDEDEFELSDLPTLVSDAPPTTPMPSAFDFPVATPGVSVSASTPEPARGADEDAALPTRAGATASTGAIVGSDDIETAEASLLPSQAAGASANPFTLQGDPFAAPVAAPETAPAASDTPAEVGEAKADAFNFDLTAEPPSAAPTAAPTPAPAAALAEDPFAAFDLSGAAPGSAPEATGAAESPVPGGTASSAADDFDLDSLFGGTTTPPVASPAPALAASAAAVAPISTPAGDETMSAADILGDDILGGDLGAGLGADDFGTDFSSFGAGLGGAAAGEIDAKTLHSIVGPTLDTLIGEVRRSLEYHTTRYPDAAVRRITLIGGGAKLKNIDAYFTQSLGIPTSVGNPLARLPLQAPKLPPGYADENGAMFVVALGLAMRELMRS
jgi:type IV pilus assembly protein PilM